MTQYLQFVLGFSAFRAGLAIGPVALVLLVTAPFSAVLARRIGTKSVVVPGLLLIAFGLGFLWQTTVSDGYRWCLPFFLFIGCGVGLALAPPRMRRGSDPPPATRRCRSEGRSAWPCSERR